MQHVHLLSHSHLHPHPFFFCKATCHPGARMPLGRRASGTFSHSTQGKKGDFLRDLFAQHPREKADVFRDFSAQHQTKKLTFSGHSSHRTGRQKQFTFTVSWLEVFVDAGLGGLRHSGSVKRSRRPGCLAASGLRDDKGHLGERRDCECRVGWLLAFC